MAIVGQTNGKSWRVIGYSIPATSPGQHAMADKCRELEEDLRTVVEVAQRNLPNPHPTIERIAGKYQVNNAITQPHEI
jgi:hypothetical protein